MGKKKAPKYAETTYDTGNLFGSSTTNKKGTVYTPANWMSGTMSTVGGNVNKTLRNMLSGDFSNDANYLAYQNNLNRQMSNAFDNDVLSQLANKGLMRSSGLQSATNAFADTLANNQMNLYDSYYNRQANNLSNLINTSNALYNYLTGINQGSMTNSNNISDYNMKRWQLNNAMGGGLSGGISGALNGAMAGSAAGPWGALGGALIGGASGAMR